MPFQIAKHDLYLKNKDNSLWERILQIKCNPGSILVSLEVENVTCFLQKCHKEIRCQIRQYMWAMACRTTKTFIPCKHLHPYLLCGPLPRSITSHIECPSPTHIHGKLNSLRWEIVLNATAWLAITTVHQSTVVIFVYSALEIGLLCAHLLHENLILPYLKTVLHPKYTLQACLLVVVMLLLM
jgi:hypothetical protein